MKSKHIHFIILLTFIASGWIAIGQSTLWNFGNSLPGPSIVRHWRGAEYVTYSETPNSGIFAYHHNNTPTALCINLPEDLLRVMDFQIFHDTVYVCGTNTSNRGFLACFPMGDFFAGTCNWNQYVNYPIGLLTADCYSDDYSDIITKYTRLCLFEYAGTTHIAFLAENQIVTAGSSATMDRIGIGDAIFYGSYWLVRYNINKDGVEHFSDITTTDDYVIASSYDPDSLRHKVRVFAQGTDYLLAEIMPGTCWGTKEQLTLGAVRVAATGQNTFAIAYNYKNESDIGIAIKMMDIVGNNVVLTQSINIPITAPNTYGWQIGDLRYCSATNTLLLADRTSTSASGVYETSIYTINVAAPTLVRKEVLTDYSPLSLSVAVATDKFFAAGEKYNTTKILYERVYATTPCPSISTISSYPIRPPLYHAFHHNCFVTPLGWSSQKTLPIYPSHVTIECKK